MDLKKASPSEWGLESRRPHLCYPLTNTLFPNLQEDGFLRHFSESTEDLSLDMGALQGTEYLRDLGLGDPSDLHQSEVLMDPETPRKEARRESSHTSCEGTSAPPQRHSWERPRSCSESHRRSVSPLPACQGSQGRALGTCSQFSGHTAVLTAVQLCDFC